jgi:NitT/TauT family transport system ATP-binding protein
MAKRSALLQVRDLSVAYAVKPGLLRVLDKISFAVPQGQFVCIIGPSGSGKTTLLRAIAGLLEPQSGLIKVNGHAVHGPQAKVAIVFQDANLMPWRTVEENIQLPLEVSGAGVSRSKVKNMIDLVGLRGFTGSLPRQLSGGMSQRVAIGRALVQDPQLLLMDEPFGSLDAITRERMGEELLRIWDAEHKTVLMVTHDISEALYLADRVLVLSQRPAQISLDLKVGLPRSRKPDIRYSKKFGALAARLRKAIG